MTILFPFFADLMMRLLFFSILPHWIPQILGSGEKLKPCDWPAGRVAGDSVVHDACCCNCHRCYWVVVGYNDVARWRRNAEAQVRCKVVH